MGDNVVLHDDRLLVSEHAIFCGSVDCKCHANKKAIRKELIAPLKEGLLTPDEMSRLYTGRQVC